MLQYQEICHEAGYHIQRHRDRSRTEDVSSFDFCKWPLVLVKGARFDSFGVWRPLSTEQLQHGGQWKICPCIPAWSVTRRSISRRSKRGIQTPWPIWVQPVWQQASQWWWWFCNRDTGSLATWLRPKIHFMQAIRWLTFSHYCPGIEQSGEGQICTLWSTPCAINNIQR